MFDEPEEQEEKEEDPHQCPECDRTLTLIVGGKYKCFGCGLKIH